MTYQQYLSAESRRRAGKTLPLMISIDNGGTFTDVCVTDGDSVVYAKTLTTPHDLSQCFAAVLRKAAARTVEGGDDELTRLLTKTEHLRYSSTIGTNAVVQRKGPRLGLLTNDPSLPTALANGCKADEELLAALVGARTAIVSSGSASRFGQDLVTAISALLEAGANRFVVSLSGRERTSEEQRVKQLLLACYPRHLLGALPILFASELCADPNDRRRTWTALLNAFLHMEVERFFWNAERILRQNSFPKLLRIFHNDGNSARVAKTVALKTYSSGPRGGLEGVRALARHYGWEQAVAMDIGGTTTDYGVVNDSRIDEEPHGEIAGVTVSFPLARMKSVGLGGSSVFRVDHGSITVGPDSVGALPGPACFSRGGTEPTLTDALLLSGVLDAGEFLGGELSLDADRARRAIMEKIAEPLGVDLDVAVHAMENAFIGRLADTLPRPTTNRSVVVAFGGGGPLVAAQVAERSGFSTVVIPAMAAVFSAYGISFSDIAHTYEIEADEPGGLDQAAATLREAARRDMFAEGFELGECELRESKTDTGLRLEVFKPIRHPDLASSVSTQKRRAKAASTRRILTGPGAFDDLPVYRVADLGPQMEGSGPAVIVDPYFVARVPSGWAFAVDVNQNIVLTFRQSQQGS